MRSEEASIRQVIYVSSGCREYNAAELELIANEGCRNNARSGITGILLHYNGNFMQLIEGPPETVGRTFERIRADKRHTGIIVLQDETVAARAFPDSRMGLRVIQSEEVTNCPELFEKLNNRWRVKSDAGIDEKLVVLFRTFFNINAGAGACA